MSTILKALKRIDQTTPPPDDLQSGSPLIDTKEAVRGRLFRIWLQRKVVLALILAVVVIAAGWLIYSQKELLISKIRPRSRSEKPPVFQAKIEPPRQSERPASQQAAPQDRQQTLSRPKSGREPLGAERPLETSPQSPFEQKNQTNRMRTSTPQARLPATKPPAQSGITRRPAAGTRGSDQPKFRPTAPTPAKKTKSRAARTARSYQRLDNAKLKLQAIAWSNNASQRIAVINDRIVREGESVEGFSINQIRQDDVVVNDGTQSWQLEFDLR